MNDAPLYNTDVSGSPLLVPLWMFAPPVPRILRNRLYHLPESNSQQNYYRTWGGCPRNMPYHCVKVLGELSLSLFILNEWFDLRNTELFFLSLRGDYRKQVSFDLLQAKKYSIWIELNSNWYFNCNPWKLVSILNKL